MNESLTLLPITSNVYQLNEPLTSFLFCYKSRPHPKLKRSTLPFSISFLLPSLRSIGSRHRQLTGNIIMRSHTCTKGCLERGWKRHLRQLQIDPFTFIRSYLSVLIYPFLLIRSYSSVHFYPFIFIHWIVLFIDWKSEVLLSI